MALRRFLPLLAVIAIAPMGLCQDAQSMLQGGGKPLTMKASALTSDYHAVAIQMAGGNGGGGIMDMLMSPMMMIMGAFGGAMSGGADTKSDNQPPFGLLSAMGLSWTTGETQSYFGQTYLVTYKLDMDMTSMATMDPKTKDFSNLNLRLTLVRTDAFQSFSPRPDVTPEAFAKMLKGPTPAPKPAAKTGK
jgi:hypothetical protein